MTSSPRIFLSCDTGIDDALAILYLVESHADLVGVSGVFGNVPEEVATKNSRDLLDFLGREEIPVYRGAARPSFWGKTEETLDKPYQVDPGCTVFHGINGFGNAELPVRPSSAKDGRGIPWETSLESQQESPQNASQALRQEPRKRFRILPDAAGAIIKAVKEFGTSLTVLATGPLTDVAEAIRREPSIILDLRLVLMGGVLTQPGNGYNLVTETNIINDPEAAQAVFATDMDITMVGLDVTHRCLVTREQEAQVKALGTPLATFVGQMLDYYLSANEKSDPVFLAGSPLHDPLAAAVALEPSLVETFPIALRVELATGVGFGVRGRTIGDPTRLNGPRPHTKVALGVDSKRFVDDWFGKLLTICSKS